MRRHLGMAPSDLRGREYAEFWQPEMAPLAPPVREAIARGSLPPGYLPALSGASRLLDEREAEVENGLSMQDDGALHLAVLTEMAGVTPAMVDWWFGWHSVEPERYKLWHPQAHVHAAWHDHDSTDRSGRERYVGRTSIVDEYIGNREGRYAIQFVRPAALGFSEKRVEDPARATAICARVGFAEYAIDIGYLVHHVVAVPGGSVMRSRFWVGGRYAEGRGGSLLGEFAARAARLVLRAPEHDLLVHCSQEMTHLASFLPALHARCGALN